ncbi:MarR family winged helix-turn-helix transcriptional regulator [Microbacterium sp. SYP-A9085]|uniref:MarR family winged helix-turn-helix transcriptional regulator n=1 Tax=Microbacterium sp. SYP-A9085 TaxID=2664454 RepID=UPI001562786D|nr:MarR family winged helix-turn-helix transcriptional regulator [Microbacterium sp. SYP-A9085]
MTRATLTPPPRATTEEAERLGLSTTVLPNAIDRDEHTPAIVNLLANTLTWGQSKVFRQLFGLGTNEWRVLSALTKYPGATASQLCAVSAMNKSVVSKAVGVLLDRGLIGQLEGTRRSQYLYLTHDGVLMHDEMATVALEMQAIVHSTLTPEEIVQVNKLMLKMLSSTSRLHSYEQNREAESSRSSA